MVGTAILVVTVAVMAILVITFLGFNRRQRNIVLNRLRLRRWRQPVAQTPPMSSAAPAPSKRIVDTVPTPTRRFTLASAGINLPAILGKPLSKLVKDPDGWMDNLAPLDVPISKLQRPAYTATGFSTDEIKALGDFPDYAALSGVRLPVPYPDFDINRAKARPYRPFRWSYHQTMSLSKMDPDWWLELESTYKTRIKQRQELYEKNQKFVLDYLPGSEIACKELMEMCIQFLCTRYPHYFRLSDDLKILYNGILETKSDLSSTSPLKVIIDNVPEDFAIMLRDPKTGHYHFRAGVICSALGWNLGSKLGLMLHEIHAPIPDYKAKMQLSMDRYFSVKPTDKSIQRGSWGLEVDQPLYMPPGDPHEKYRDVQLPDLTVSRCNLRVDWQTLRRLPLSGATVFNFKALFSPVTSFRDEPFIPALLLKILREANKDLMQYKNTWHTEHVIIPALEEYAAEQVREGIVPEDWEPRTLEMESRDSPPCFPGWEQKWHREQGF